MSLSYRACLVMAVFCLSACEYATEVVKNAGSTTNTAKKCLTSTALALQSADSGDLAPIAKAKGFVFGFAVSPSSLKNTKIADIIRRHATHLVGENAFKPSHIVASWAGVNPTDMNSVKSKMNFTEADAIADFARANGKRLRGHTLVWHGSDPTGVPGNFTKAQNEALLRNYITIMVKRYADVTDQWDVVNEIMGKAPDGIHTSAWYQRLGDSFVDIAFDAAHKADPKAQLFWNDFHDYPSICAMAKKYKARGVPIHGVGLQSHFYLDKKSTRAYPTSLTDLKCFGDAGLDTAITEFDAAVVLPSTKTLIEVQAETAKGTLANCLNKAAHCHTFMAWGVYDGNSWQNKPATADNPAQGEPLLFDDQFHPKPAFEDIYATLSGLQGSASTPAPTNTGGTTTPTTGTGTTTPTTGSGTTPPKMGTTAPTTGTTTPTTGTSGTKAPANTAPVTPSDPAAPEASSGCTP